MVCKRWSSLPGDALFDVAALESLYDGVPTVCVRATDERSVEPAVVGDGGPIDVAGLEDERAGSDVDAGACSLPAEATGWTRPPPNDAGERDLATVVDGRVEEMTRLHGPVRVADGAFVADGAVVEGPSVVDAEAVVDPNAYVGPYSYVGPGVTVGHSTRIANAVLLEGARVGATCALEDSIVGPEADVGPGTTVANREQDPIAADRAPGSTIDRDEPSIRGGEHSFGVVVGGRARIDGGVHLGTGVVVPRYVTVEDDGVIRREDAT